MRNSFFIWEQDADAAREFTPREALAMAETSDHRYIFGVLAEADALLPDEGATFLVTWDVDAFDERFDGAVVFLIGDEKYQVPSYADRVRAIFRTGGTRPNPLGSTLALSPAVSWRLLARAARNRLLTGHRRLAGRPRSPAPTFELPLGYFRLIDVPSVPFVDRGVDVSFAGFLESSRGFTMRPRIAARRQMARALEVAQRRRPDLRVQFSTAGPFGNAPEALDAETYSQRLADAKIVLCPRGNFDETFRLCEAARSGCVAVSETLPPRWYYRDPPVVELRSWRALPDVLDTLLDEGEALQQRAARMREWWDDTLSEPAVGRHVASSLAGTGTTS